MGQNSRTKRTYEEMYKTKEERSAEIKNLLTKDIREICNSDPRVFPTQIQVNEFERGFLIEVSLSMRNTNQTSNLRLMFDQKIGLTVQ